jgi:hypothetical protein
VEYPDWIQRVFDVAATTWQKAEEQLGHVLAIPIDSLAEPLGLVEDPAWYGSDAHEALIDAMRDIDGISLINIRDGNNYKLNDRGEMAAGKQISSGWQRITAVRLTDRQEALLRTVAESAVQPRDTYARLIHVNAAEAWSRSKGFDEAPGVAFPLAKQLEEKGWPSSTLSRQVRPPCARPTRGISGPPSAQ